MAIVLTVVFCGLGITLIVIGYSLNVPKDALIGLAFFHMGIAVLAVQFKKKRASKVVNFPCSTNKENTMEKENIV